MKRHHASGTWYIAPASNRGDEYAAGYDGNCFATQAEALAELPELCRCIESVAAVDLWVVVQRPTSRFYDDGFRDGLAWDLGDYQTIDDVRNDPHGWDCATLEVCGRRMCADVWGIDPDDDEAFDEAARDYNAGAHAGALAPQEERTGLPPRDYDES